MAKKMEKGLNLPTYDTRLLEKNLRDGLIDRKEYDAHLKKLADDESNAEYIEIVDETTADTDAENESGKNSPERLTFT